MGLEYNENGARNSVRRLLKSKALNIALYALVATVVVGWSSGWLTGPATLSKLEERAVVYQQSIEKLEHVFKYQASSTAWWTARKRPSSAAATPFSTFTCLGDEHAVDMIYTKPFRFHVYLDMPDELYNGTVARATKFWEPDHR